MPNNTQLLKQHLETFLPKKSFNFSKSKISGRCRPYKSNDFKDWNDVFDILSFEVVSPFNLEVPYLAVQIKFYESDAPFFKYCKGKDIPVDFQIIYEEISSTSPPLKTFKYFYNDAQVIEHSIKGEHEFVTLSWNGNSNGLHDLFNDLTIINS